MNPVVLSERTKHRVNLLALDDHLIILEGLRSSLHSHYALEVVNFPAAVKYAIQNGKVDLLLVDFFLGKVDTTPLIRWVNANYPEIPVIVLTAYINSSLILKLSGLHVRGILDKSELATTLPNHIEAVLHGERAYSNSVSEAAIDALAEFQKSKGSIQNKKKTIDSLSDIERKILEQLTQGAPTSQISMQLGITPRSVEHYRRTLRSKLHVHSNVQLVLAAYELGIGVQP